MSDVPNLAQSLFLAGCEFLLWKATRRLTSWWEFWFPRPSLSAIPPSGWLARAWMANLLKGPQMPSGITEMGFNVQEKDPRKNERVQKIKMHFHWSWTCKSYTINHSHLKICINGPEFWGSHMVCLCNIWFGHLFGISMKICQCQVQTHACSLLGINVREKWKNVSLNICFGTMNIGGSGKEPEDRESIVSGRKQRAGAMFSQAKVLEHRKQHIWKGTLPHPIYPRCASGTRGRSGPDAPW